ncbi:MAG: polyamine aminopropyltransferase [Cytophagales bacterium]|nr:polyamine aminopropyltransferase [Cytophagales bacterium]
MIALGRHIIAELYSCDIECLNDVTFVEKAMLEAADRAGATVINSTFHHFSPFGVSGVIVIQESHFSIHCWPEYGYASIDIYTCGDTVDPWVAYAYLKDKFSAAHGSTVELNRGQRNLLATASHGPHGNNENRPQKKPAIQSSRNIWFTERNESIALSLKHDGERLYNHTSDYQKIEIYQTEALGKILVLDGNIACAEEDEYVYHEMIAHVPVLAHTHPKKVLVIGGGDGGTVRELVKHKTIESIDLVEIDQFVIEAAQNHLPALSSSLTNERVKISIEDGVNYAALCASESYDVVIIDSDDPGGPSKGLFTERFYRDAFRILRPGGIMVTQSESPRFNRHIFTEVYQCYFRIFGKQNVSCYLMFLPSFPSGMWSFSFCAKGDADPMLFLDRQKADRFSNSHRLKYYNYEVHAASFVLPKFVKDMLQ